MGMFGRTLLNIAGRNLLGVDFEAQKRQQAQQEAIARAEATAAGVFQPLPGAPRQAQITADDGADITAGFGPVMEQGPGRRRTSAEMMEQLAPLARILGPQRMAQYLSMANQAKPTPKTALNTSRGPREYDAESGEYRVLEKFEPEPPKPEPVTTDRVIAGILQKKAMGEALNPGEIQLYNRWFSGTPAKGGGGGGGGRAAPKPPSGFVVDP